VIRLYRAPFSTNVERVALALAHKGLEVESVWISYADRSPVERVSGQSLVPVLEFDDGAVVFDSMQIVRVLEERFPAAPLYPAGFAGRARVIRFIDWFNDVWKVAPNAIEAEVGAPQPDVDRIDGLAAEMAAGLDRFEAMLSLDGGRGYLLGDEFGAADCCAYPFLKYAAWRDPADDERFHRVLDGYQQLGDAHPQLAAWIARIDERPRV
jgi:glutathione S-transferase